MVLNKAQQKNIKDKISENKSKSFVMDRMAYYGLNPEQQIATYDALLDEAKGVFINDIDAKFSGIQVATRENLNDIIQRGSTGDWQIDHERAAAFKMIRIASMVDRGLYLTATIVKLDTLENGKTLVFFEKPIFFRHPHNNIKFDRNVVAYIEH